MEVIKHNWPEGVDPDNMWLTGFTIFNAGYVYLFEYVTSKEAPARIFYEYRADRRSWRRVEFGDGIWNNPYAPKPKGGGNCG